MGFRSTLDEWELRHANTPEGDLYREKERLKEELEQSKYRQRQDDYEREQQEYRARTQRERDRENRIEQIGNAMSAITEKDAEIEHLQLCLKFGIQEAEP